MFLGCQAVRFNPSIANHKMVSIAYIGLLKLSLHVTVHGAEDGKQTAVRRIQEFPSSRPPPGLPPGK